MLVVVVVVVADRSSRAQSPCSSVSQNATLAFDAFLVVATAHTDTRTVLWLPVVHAVRTYSYVLRACACARSPLSFLFLFPWEGGSFCVALPTPGAFPLHVAVAVLVDG